MSSVVSFDAVPDDAELLAISKLAVAKNLHLITNGTRSALCSIIPPGWKVIPVREKKAA